MGFHERENTSRFKELQTQWRAMCKLLVLPLAPGPRARLHFFERLEGDVEGGPFHLYIQYCGIVLPFAGKLCKRHAFEVTFVVSRTRLF